MVAFFLLQNSKSLKIKKRMRYRRRICLKKETNEKERLLYECKRIQRRIKESVVNDPHTHTHEQVHHGFNDNHRICVRRVQAYKPKKKGKTSHLFQRNCFELYTLRKQKEDELFVVASFHSDLLTYYVLGCCVEGEEQKQQQQKTNSLLIPETKHRRLHMSIQDATTRCQ